MTRIKELRKQTSLTQTEFGKLFGIPLRTIQGWENGERKAPPYVENMIERILVLEKIIPKPIQKEISEDLE